MSSPSAWPNRTSKRFRELLAALPADVQRQARKAFKQYEADPTYPGLHFERLRTTGPYYSARINEQYRVLGKRKADHMLWFWIGSHDAYDKLIAQL